METSRLFDAYRRLSSPASAVALWQVDLAWPGIDEPAWDCLSPEEHAHRASLRQAADRRRYAATRTALRRLLAQQLRCPPASLRFAAGAHGKPMLDMPGAPAFNVSHAGDYAWLAIGEAPGCDAVGVDIERIDPTLQGDWLHGVAAHSLTPCERAWLGAQPAALMQGAFFSLWTAKEALLKALGVGIAEHLLHVSVLPSRDSARSRFTVMPESGPFAAFAAALARCELYGLRAPDGYAAAMAWLPPG